MVSIGGRIFGIVLATGHVCDVIRVNVGKHWRVSQIQAF